MLYENADLFVSWRSPKTRLIHPVGRLGFNASTHHYDFHYIQSVSRAVTDGFTPFTEFPGLEAVYRSAKLFPLFANRVMPPSRPDYASFLQALGLSPDSAHPMAILARTGGRRETDQIELFSVPNVNAAGCYTTYCLLRSIRYMPQPVTEERITKLKVEEKLFLMLDLQNPVDPNAIAVRTDDNFMIGYLPAYLASDLVKLKAGCPSLDVFVARVNAPPAEAHHRLLCQIVSCWPAGFQPFNEEVFQPYASGEVSPK